jgi:hypothetical protein
MPALVDSITNPNAQSEAMASQSALADNEAMVAELAAQVAELSERVACGLRKIDALRLNRCSSDRPGDHPPDGTKNPGTITLSAW